MKKPVLSILQFHREFPTDAACLDRLFRDRFPHPRCPLCTRVNQYYRIASRPRYSCACGRHHLFPKKGTIFEKSKTNLVKWFFAIYLFSQSRNGVAAKELERELNVTYKTAWRMARQIRSVMREHRTLSGEVEADEVLIGGRIEKKDRWKNKTLVFGAVERRGTVHTAIIPDASVHTISQAVRAAVAQGSRLLTDKAHAYRNVSEDHGYRHEAVNHSAQEYVRGDVHTNTIEGFFSQVTRSLSGTYHAVSGKWMDLYVSEFEFRYNHGRREDLHLFEILLRRVARPPA